MRNLPLFPKGGHGEDLSEGGFGQGGEAGKKKKNEGLEVTYICNAINY